MTLSLTQNFTAIVPGATFAQFVAVGGTAPYTYSVLAGGAGGSINTSSGAYTAPPVMSPYPPAGLYDTIQVIDSLSAMAASQILVGTPLFLVCDILQTQLGIANDHIYLWDQKVFQPTDSNLYLAIAMTAPKPFSNNNLPLSTGIQAYQYVNMYARLEIDIISRGPAARDQKELVLLAFNSVYSQQQQDANGFYIGKLPIMGGFINLSQIDGAAIPYRYKISYAMQYQVNLTQSVPYYDTFQPQQIYTNP
jgi:hypothetical protein